MHTGRPFAFCRQVLHRASPTGTIGPNPPGGRIMKTGSTAGGMKVEKRIRHAMVGAAKTIAELRTAGDQLAREAAECYEAAAELEQFVKGSVSPATAPAATQGIAPPLGLAG